MEAAAQRGVPLRLIGGIAVRLHANPELLPAVRREPKDIDLVTLRGKGTAVSALMKAAGYEESEEFNNLNGHRRLLFFDVANNRQVDVFVGEFEMCHAIPITERIELDKQSVPLAELLLTKLQVVRLNEKDQSDILAVLSSHPVGDSDDETINAAYIAQLLAKDWGLWRTTKMNVERTRVAIERYDLPDRNRQEITERLDALWRRIESEPKSGRWRLRARVGDRMRWYEEPEEVEEPLPSTRSDRAPHRGEG